MIHKSIIGISLCFVLSACASLGWLAGKSVLPKRKTPIHIQALAGNQGALSGRDLTNIEAHQVHISNVPWSIIWLLMIGWPLALVGWMIDPPCEIYRRYKDRHQSHVEP